MHQTLKLALINQSDVEGGAARAAHRIHEAIRRYGVDSRMYVNRAYSDDWTVVGPAGKFRKALASLRAMAALPIVKLLKTSNSVLHSPAVFPSRWPSRLRLANPDILHLHWINGEMLSIGDVARLRTATIWTLHDMWAFCGAEHYSADMRWRDGYFRSNRPSHESGLDLNRLVWARKRRNWKSPMKIVTPSHWLASCVEDSALMRDWPVTVIPNAIDTEAWRPVERVMARQLLGLPIDAPVLLFGAASGSVDPRKGFDLLEAALGHLRGQAPGLELVVFGQAKPKNIVELGFPTHYVGKLRDDISLRALYSAADAMVIPSRQDNLPNTGLEASACGTPVVAFDTGGMSDIVAHKVTGYLANPFDSCDLAEGLRWVATDFCRNAALGQAARERACTLWSYKVVARQYLEAYEELLSLGPDRTPCPWRS